MSSITSEPGFGEDRLSPLDAAFLYLERPTEPLHVGALAVLEGTVPFDAFSDALASRLGALRRYRQRPERATLDWHAPAWVDDRAFDARRHIRRVEVPAPGDDAALHALVDRLFASSCDPAAPLWETYLIDGLSGGRAAILTKVHHCMVDGVSGAKVLEVMTEGAPGDDVAVAPSATAPSKRASGALAALADAVAGIGSTLATAVSPREALARTRAALAAAGAVAALGREPVRPLPFNGTLGAARRIRWAHFLLDDFLAMRGKAGCKVNDIVLAVIAGALRAYLVGRGDASPSGVVRALVPVNVRGSEDALALGNRVSAMVASLPIDEADPIERLRRVVANMRDLKERGQSRALETALDVAGAVPAAAAPLVVRLASLRPLVNTVCTNVPGPREQRHVLGRRILEIHPIVPLALDIGMSFAIMSYAGGLSICLNSDPRLVPDVERLPRLLAASTDELRTRLGVDVAAPPRPRAAAPAGAPTVGELMSREPVTVGPHATLGEAWIVMRERRIRHLPVVDGAHRLLGLVTHRDLLAAAQSSLTFAREEERVRILGRSTVEDIMETHLSTTTPAERAAAAGQRMVRHKIGCLPVLGDDGTVIGIVTEEDFLRWAADRMAVSAA